MDADRSLRTAGVAGLLLLGVVAAPPVEAEGLFGSVQIQTQRVDDVVLVPTSGGALVPRRFSRDMLLQTYDLNHRAYPRANVLVHTSLRFTGVSYGNSPNALRAPEGSIRLLHPWLNLFASHEQATATVGVAEPGSVAADSATTLSVTTRQTQDQFVARIAPPRWPELDTSWRFRNRAATDLVPGEDSRQRIARLSYSNDRGSVYAGVSDQHVARKVPSATPLDQTVAGAGGSLRLTPLRHLGLTLRYDLTDTRSGFQGQRTTKTRTDVGEASGDWRPAPKWSGNLNWLWRRTQSTQLLAGVRNDHEGVALMSWQPSPLGRLSAGGGVRTTADLDRNALLSYLTAIASGDGAVRHGWRANAILTLTRNFDPIRGVYSVATAGGSTHMAFGPHTGFDGNLQVTANGDTASAAQRATNAWSLRLYVVPLRTLTAAVNLRSFRVGPGLFRPTGISSTRGLDLTWRPVPVMDLTGTFASTGLLPDNTQRLSTQTVTGHLLPRPAISITGSWSKSSQRVTSTGGARLTGREIATGRAQITLSRKLAASAGVTVADPGRAGESKQYDAVFTWSFGR